MTPDDDENSKDHQHYHCALFIRIEIDTIFTFSFNTNETYKKDAHSCKIYLSEKTGISVLYIVGKRLSRIRRQNEEKNARTQIYKKL